MNENKIVTIFVRPEEKLLWFHRAGLQQTASGYGKKLATRYVVNLYNRQYRVYATCLSNAASCWITIQGQRFYIG